MVSWSTLSWPDLLYLGLWALGGLSLLLSALSLWWGHPGFLVRINRALRQEVTTAQLLPTGQWPRLLLAGILLVAVMLRTAGLGWGLETEGVRHASPYHDEGHIMGIVLSKDILQAFGEYEVAKSPYLWRGMALPWVLWGLVGGAQLPLWEFLRAITALFGIATVYVVYVLGKKLGGEAVGLFAAATMAVLPGAWFYSQLVKEEGLVIFFIAFTLMTVFLLLESGASWWYALAGAALGMGMAVKLTTLVVVPALVLAVLGRALQERKAVTRYVAKILLLGVTFSVFFLLGYPYPLAAPERFWQAVADPQSAWSRFGVAGGAAPDSLWEALTRRLNLSPAYLQGVWEAYQSPERPYFALMYGEGVTYAALLGFPVLLLYTLWALRRWPGAITYGCIALVTLVTFQSLTYYGVIEDRYVLSLAPFLSLIVARLFWFDLSPVLQGPWGRLVKLVKGTLLGLGGLLLLYTAWFSLAYFIPFAWKNPRDEAARWIYRHVGPQEQVGVLAPGPRDAVVLNEDKVRVVPLLYEGERAIPLHFPEYMLLYSPPAYRARWQGGFLEGPRREQPFGPELPARLERYYRLIQTFGAEPQVWGERKPTTIINPVIHLYQRLRPPQWKGEPLFREASPRCLGEEPCGGWLLQEKARSATAIAGTFLEVRFSGKDTLPHQAAQVAGIVLQFDPLEPLEAALAEGAPEGRQEYPFLQQRGATWYYGTLLPQGEATSLAVFFRSDGKVDFYTREGRTGFTLWRTQPRAFAWVHWGITNRCLEVRPCPPPVFVAVMGKPSEGEEGPGQP